MKKNILIIIAVIAILIVGGGAFYGGMIYGKSQSATASTALRTAFASRTGRDGGGGGFISGSIIAEDNSSITIKLPNNGGSKIIFYSPTTQIGKMTSRTSSDLTNGTNISVTGTTNSDGTVTAQSIQIRPAMPYSAGQ